jgi:hypothetical protein
MGTPGLALGQIKIAFCILGGDITTQIGYTSRPAEANMQTGSDRPAKNKIQIPYAQIEYTGTFKVPIVKAFAPPTGIIENLLRALKPHGFSIDGVEARSREKATDCAVELRRALPVTSFKVTPAKIVVTADNPDWSNREKLIETVKTGLHAVLGLEHSELESQLFVLAMHVQLQDKPRKEITAPLLSTTAYELLSGDSEFQGIVLTRIGVSVVIDASNVHANALFVRLVREHKPTTTIDQIADQLYADETHIFEVLGLDGEL